MKKQSGFALFEALLVAGIVVMVVGLGYYVLQQNVKSIDEHDSAVTVNTKKAEPTLSSKGIEAMKQAETVGTSSTSEELKIEDDVETEYLNRIASDQSAAAEIGEVDYENQFSY